MTQVQLGQIVTTAGVAEWIRGDQSRSVGVARAVWRHRSRDWGNVCAEDWEANNEASRDGGRLHSTYKIGRREVWVITEWDRSVTTILFPEEY
jgi:hypothetical protein